MVGGFAIIGDMSREEMIEEIIAGQRALLVAEEDDTLKRHVINLRLSQFKDRLVKEAQIQPMGPFGLLGGDSD